MADLDALTDAELRRKLIEYGFPVVPITGTTRKVMVKKLRLLMEKGGKANTRHTLAQFSSEEESDGGMRKERKGKSRRATTMTAMSPPASTKVKRLGRSATEALAKMSVYDTKTRTGRLMHMADKENETNSDSEPEIVETDYKMNEFSTSGIFTSSQNNSPSSYSLRSSHTPNTSNYSYKNQNNSVYSTGSKFDSSYENVIESDTENIQTPFLSNFTKRLSQLSTSKNSIDEKPNESDTNGFGLYNKSYMTRLKPRDTSQYNGETSKGNYISFLLFGSVAIFFLILAVLYLGMHRGETPNFTGLNIPYCKKTDRRGENCILEHELDGILDLYTFMKPQLVKTAVAHFCDDGSKPSYMTISNIVSFIIESTNQEEEFEILNDLSNFIIVSMHNPNWDISILQSNTGDLSEKNKINSLDEIFENKKNNFETALVILDPSLPLGCNVYLKFLSIFKLLSLTLLLTGVFWVSKRCYTYYKFYEQRKKEEVVLMVEKVLDMLQCQASDEEENFLVVNHVRDNILPINNRKSMERVWGKTVKFINENESRVRTEVLVVKGEPCEVWRWLGGRTTSSPRNKSWQGQAFETQAGSVNSPPCSPTPCLKIRGMVEDGDRHLHTIREAVLVKCADKCRILHCSVDLNSKCVYLKCADQNDAAIAYRNLHGWWYASQLVTVKYLRLERYMQRFPVAPLNGPPFLKPHQAK